MSHYLVTGAAGFIGSNLVDHLLSEGETVTALDNLSTGLASNIAFLKKHPNAHLLTFIEGDITDLKTCMTACEGKDFVLHQAALGSVPRSLKEPHLYNENNIVGTFNMMSAARDAGVKRFVYASSSSVYGDTPTLPKVETMVPRPKSPYAISKITNEYYGKVFTQEYGLPTIGLRYFNVFGPRQSPTSDYAAAIPKFVTAYLNNQSPTIYGDGEQTRDFTFIKNVIKANLNACQAEEDAFGLAYNIGCGSRISINDLVFAIKDIIGSDKDPIYEPSRAGDVRDSLSDVRLSEKHLNLTETISLKDGLIPTIEWYKSKSDFAQ